jgi:hypothetical protein
MGCGFINAVFIVKEGPSTVANTAVPELFAHKKPG